MPRHLVTLTQAARRRRRRKRREHLLAKYRRWGITGAQAEREVRTALRHERRRVPRPAPAASCALVTPALALWCALALEGALVSLSQPREED